MKRLLKSTMANKITKDKLITYLMIATVLIVLLILLLVNRESFFNKIKLNFVDKKNYVELFKGLWNTIFITIVAFILGLIIGAIVCLVEGLQSQNAFILILKKITKVYVSIFRGTPTTVQLLIIYFVIFASYKGNTIFIAMLTFGLNSGAYVSEILRGGINAVPVGQMEAGRSLGLSYGTVMKKIIFPQAIKNALPSLGNEFITLIKETSIAGFIGAIDLTLAFRKIANATYDFQTVYLVMGVVYFVIVLLITIGLKQIERRLFKYAKA